MNRTILALFLFVVSVSMTLAQRQKEHLFYYVNSEECYQSLQKNIGKISLVAPAAYYVDEDGVMWGAVDPRVLEVARRHKVGVMPLIVNPGFDQIMLHKLLINPIARSRAVQSMVEQCSQYGYVGMQFDFENLNFGDRDAYTQFYREAAEALHAKGFTISVAVVHRPEEFAGPTDYHKWLYENWRAGYDLKELAAIGDFVTVMTYSQHTRRTTPGPNAGIPWMKKIVENFLRFMPPEKLSLGIPTSSMHWYTALDTARYYANARSWSTTMSYARARGVAERFKAKILWHEEQQVPYTTFENAGLFEHIYFEDARSFKAKLELVGQYKLRGCSVWVLGDEDQEVWKVLPDIVR